MKFYQRIEVWVLLLAMALAAVWVLKPGEEAAWQAEEPVAKAEGALKLLGATLERDYGNARLDLEVRVRNAGVHPLLLTPPQARLWAGSVGEREVAPFFLPAERPPEVAPGVTSEMRLRYWLEEKDVQGPLWLQVGEEKVAVKSAAAFDWSPLENGKAVRLRGVAW